MAAFNLGHFFQAAKPPAPPKPSGYFSPSGKPTFANSPQVKNLAPTPTGGYNVSGYFNSAGKPTFANSPQVTGLAQTPTGLPAPGSQNPGQSPGTSGTQTGQPQLPPMDATAAANIANNQFNVGNQVNALQNRTIPGLQQALAASLGQLDYQQPRDELTAEQNANRLGALYSSVYNQNLGDLIHRYATQRDTLTTNEGQQEQAALDQIAALQGGIPLYNWQQSAAAGQRLAQAAANNPATGQPTPPSSHPGASGPGQTTGAQQSGGRPSLAARAAAAQRAAALKAEQNAVAQAKARRGFSSTVRRIK